MLHTAHIQLGLSLTLGPPALQVDTLGDLRGHDAHLSLSDLSPMSPSLPAASPTKKQLSSSAHGPAVSCWTESIS